MHTRDRIRDAGAQMFRRNGYTGTGVKQVAAAAGAQLGSLYHFFPGGQRLRRRLPDRDHRPGGGQHQ